MTRRLVYRKFVPSFAQGKPFEKAGRKANGAKVETISTTTPARLPEVIRRLSMHREEAHEWGPNPRPALAGFFSSKVSQNETPNDLKPRPHNL
jgi:hypothetical protein